CIRLTCLQSIAQPAYFSLATPHLVDVCNIGGQSWTPPSLRHRIMTSARSPTMILRFPANHRGLYQNHAFQPRCDSDTCSHQSRCTWPDGHLSVAERTSLRRGFSKRRTSCGHFQCDAFGIAVSVDRADCLGERYVPRI